MAMVFASRWSQGAGLRSWPTLKYWYLECAFPLQIEIHHGDQDDGSTCLWWSAHMFIFTCIRISVPECAVSAATSGETNPRSTRHCKASKNVLADVSKRNDQGAWRILSFDLHDLWKYSFLREYKQYCTFAKRWALFQMNMTLLITYLWLETRK